MPLVIAERHATTPEVSEVVDVSMTPVAIVKRAMVCLRVTFVVAAAEKCGEAQSGGHGVTHQRYRHQLASDGNSGHQQIGDSMGNADIAFFMCIIHAAITSLLLTYDR